MTICGFYLLTLLAVLGYRTCNTSTTSQPKIAFGTNCNDTSHCITTNAVCNERCSCTNNMYHNATGDTCTDKIAFGTNCTYTWHCITTNAVCNERCSCTNNMYFYATGDTCTDKIAFGTNCTNTWHCITTNAVCNERCSCTNNMYHDATGDTCTDKITFGANCNNASHCITGNAVCYETCSCTNNMYHNATGDTCTYKKGYGDSCSSTDECDVPQGGNSQCVTISAGDVKCLCSDALYWSGSQCLDRNALKPILSLSNPGQRTLDATWTANEASEYTTEYTLTWKPSSSSSQAQTFTTSDKAYTITLLNPGTPYTVSILRTITEKTHGRVQGVPGNEATETTRSLEGFGEVCSASVRCDVTDTNVACTQTTEQGVNRCLCTAGTYRPSDSCVAIAPGLKPALQDAGSTETRRINVRWTNDDDTGGYGSLYMVKWIQVPSGTSGSDNTTLKNHFIQPLSPGTTYTVTVTHIITQYNRNQLIPSVARTYTTKQEYGGACSSSVPCDDASNTISCNSLVSKCLCVDGTYHNGQACVQYSTLSPNFGTTTTGTSYVYVQWSDQPASNYIDVYRLTISSDGTERTATGKFYNFTNLQQGTDYTVSLVRTITRYGRTQSLPAVTTTTRTKVGYNQTCVASDTCIDTHTSCQGSKCRCDVRFYWDTNCVSIDGLKPSAVTVSWKPPTTMTASWVSPDNAVVTGFEVTVMPGDTNQITVGRDIRTTPITGLTPGRGYTVSVKTKITYLQGRDEKTIPFSAQPKVTTPDTVGWLGDKTNLTAPNIIIDFLRADGDVGYYLVQLQGITDGGYLQSMPVAPPATNTTFNGVVPNYQYTLTITTHSNQQQSIPYTRTIRVRASQAGTVNDFQKTSFTSRNVSVSWMRPVSTNGDLYEYRLEVFHGTCKQRIVFNCTECIRNASVDGSENCENTIVVPISDINNPMHVVNYKITGLLPDTQYVAKVAAYNKDGRGMDSSVAVLTNEEAAGETTAFRANSKTSDSITLTWAPPVPRPGVTHYNISVYEKNETTNVFDYNGIQIITGYYHNMYTVTKLSSAWEYKFYIQAFTLKGGSENVSSGVVLTEESAPIEVNNFKLRRIPKVYNKLKLSWDCPKRKDGRNGIITSAILIYHTNETSVNYTKRGNKTYANTNACKWEEPVEVTPDFFYLFTVQVRNSFQGLPSTIWAFIPVGAPSLDKTIVSVRSGGGAVGTSVIPLVICAACLYANGKIVKSGLLVCKVGDCQIRNDIDDTRGDYYDKLPNWHSARGSGFTSLYRATADDWMSGKERDDIVSYTVGGETCEIADQTRFCNGPLLTDKSYRVWAFACTSVGCTETPYVEVAVTAATETTDVGTVVGAVVGVIVFAVIVIIIIVVYVRVIRKSGSKKNQDRINVEPTHKLDDTYDEIGDGQRMHVIRESNSNDGGYVNQASGHSPDGFDSTYDQLATYQNADTHDYGHINVTTSNKGTRSKR